MDTLAEDPLLDLDRLAELAEEVGEEDLSAVLLMFLDEASAEVARLASGLGDAEHAKATHFLRSGALNIGLGALARAAAEAAEAAPAGRAASGAAIAALVARSRAAVLARG
ncbi:histidine kinase [Jannaschia sp. W003]|uniref:histidine kinase n=1 Tax=Jannaschia sp. W003 TaxID=2867012 RepID=UPI0021A51146|nr:histidine kinase [Jannaschia sp. W003]UWQ22142.1 histidine kinase [Jannaschia sp. W003]